MSGMRFDRVRAGRRGRRAVVALTSGLVLVAGSFALPTSPAAADNGSADYILFPPVGPDARFGDPVRFNGNLSDSSLSCTTVFDCDTPTGTVYIDLTGPGGSTQLSGPTEQLLTGVSTYVIPTPAPLPAGDYEATMFFIGDFDIGLSTTELFTIGKRSCETTLGQSVSHTATNAPLTFTAYTSAVSAPSSGTVQFFQEAGAVDILLDSQPVVGATNSATTANVGTLLPAGDTQVYAVYSGDSQHQGPCTSNVVTHNVSAVAPPAANDDTVITPRGQAVAFNPLSNDVAGGAGPLVGADILGAGTASGELTVSGTTFTYTPEPGFVGDDAFDYYAYDNFGGQSAPAHVNIVVSCDAVALPDEYQTDAGQTLVVADATGVLANDDPCGGELTVVGQPSHGTLTAIDRAAGGFTYIPDPGFFGTDTFTYTYNSGLAVTAQTTAAIRVVAPPVVTTTTTTTTSTSTTSTTTSPSTTTTSPSTTTTTVPVEETTTTTTGDGTTTTTLAGGTTTSTALPGVSGSDLGNGGTGSGSGSGGVPSSGELARTGSNLRGPTSLAGVLLLVGGVFLLATRRRPAR